MTRALPTSTRLQVAYLSYFASGVMVLPVVAEDFVKQTIPQHTSQDTRGHSERSLPRTPDISDRLEAMSEAEYISLAQAIDRSSAAPALPLVRIRTQ